MRPRHAAAEKDGRKSTEWKETIVPSPADDDPIEMDEARRLFEGNVVYRKPE